VDKLHNRFCESHLSRISISSLKHGLNVSVGPFIEAKPDFSLVRLGMRILLCHSLLAIWWVNNLEHHEDILVGQSRKPSKDELSCSPFVEVSNATLGNTGRALDLEIGSVSVRALARKVAFVAMVGCRMADSRLSRRDRRVRTPKLSRRRARRRVGLRRHGCDRRTCRDFVPPRSAKQHQRHPSVSPSCNAGTRTLHCANLTSPEDGKVPLTSTASR
jgi:hypothetical protein